jgi:hypothetical protein
MSAMPPIAIGLVRRGEPTAMCHNRS